MSEKKEIKVQVVCVTYNQKEYIKEALDSFIMQKTNFGYEVLVGDDGSTDGTSEIVAEYAKKYPDIIKHIKRSSNIGALENFMDICDRVTSKYAAFCDGDDFWTNENKLQKQYDFMESNNDVNICAHKTKIQADKEWSLYNYYAKQDFIQPNEDNIPSKNRLILSDIVYEWPHTSSLFIRWNNIEIPANLKTDGFIGDMPMIFLHMGQGHLYILNEVMSVYRRGVSGVFNNKTSMDDHFLNTRLEYFKILTTCIDYYIKHYDSFCINKLQGRLWTEAKNYANAIIGNDRWDLLTSLEKQYPEVYQMTKNLFYGFNIRLNQVNILGKENADLLNNRKILKILNPFISFIRNIKNIVFKMFRFSLYWWLALIPKNKNLWVFSGFSKTSYMDNTQYFYEYIIKNHPEIKTVWLTMDDKVFEQLNEEKMPCYKMNSFAGFWTMVRAKLAVSDHFKMSDYTPRYGLNAGTKFVNLWHGVGPKSMIPIGNELPNTTVPGARLSSDILINNDDGIINKIIKPVKYFFKAPFRELFEEYYGMVCPGQPFRDIVANPWKIPENAQLACGYPRNITMYENIEKEVTEYKILYAPTYRWKPETEQFMVKDFIKNLDKINNLLEKIDAVMYLRLHPHTWRNYTSRIKNAIAVYPRIEVSDEKDIYASLYEYSQIITDYSSIGYDFLITQKPVIYFAFDLDTFEKEETTFNMPYKENCAGDVTKTWEETIFSIEENYNNPDRHKELKSKILEKFFPSEYNNINNSERLTGILKTKLKIK